MSQTKSKLGELIIMGFSGTQLSPQTQKTILDHGFRNFILFAHNYENKNQLIALTDELQSLVHQASNGSDHAFISVDQEGGRVQRFKNDFTLLPTARAIGDLGSAQTAFELAQIQARELFAAGIQLNFSPVCDINTNPGNPVIGNRAFGDTENIVTKMATSITRGHLDQSVQACLKHFPGHGDTHVDSHFALPTVNTPLETLRAREWLPFRGAINVGAQFVMSAHIMLPHLDPDRPGTLSSTFLKTYLRNELGYRGIIVSDDMEMHAITEHYGVDTAPVLALQAGCDQVCYRSEEQALAALESIQVGASRGDLNLDLVADSIERSRKIRDQALLASRSMSSEQRASIIGHPDHITFVRDHFSQ